MSRRSAAGVISTYSTSFTVASRLLSPRIRRDIEALYAVVRIADEIVDGTAAAAGCTPGQVRGLLENYEELVLGSLGCGFSADPIVHAFGATARACDFDPGLLRSFFAAMRRDLTRQVYDPRELGTYIYGSAEVIGLLCLDIFLRETDTSPADRARMEQGARRLGSAFQKINFLRDRAEDAQLLGRTYLQAVGEEGKQELLLDIRADLDAARASIPLLPLGARAGVRAATELYDRLLELIDGAPLEELSSTRIRVPASTKAGLAVTAVFKEVLRR